VKPDSTVIYFTVCLGTGYGIIVSLILILFQSEVTIDQNIKLIIAIISYFLIISGLLSSTLHLGHPKRAWRALSQWRSSWLSREGVASIFTFAPLTLFFIFWIFTNYTKIIFLLLIASSISSIITTICTAKIYSSIKAIPAWNNPLVPIIYILNSLVLGSLFTFTLLYYFQIKINMLSNMIISLSITTLFIKLLYWYSIRRPSNSNIATATGLGSKEKTSFFEGPHTNKNFLSREMINKINFSKSILLRIAVCIFTYITPSYYLLQRPYFVMNDYIISYTLIIISIIALIGMFIERYLFFIESKHTVSLYYGNKTI